MRDSPPPQLFQTLSEHGEKLFRPSILLRRHFLPRQELSPDKVGLFCALVGTGCYEAALAVIMGIAEYGDGGALGGRGCAVGRATRSIFTSC